jgi:hypothetical protein
LPSKIACFDIFGSSFATTFLEFVINIFMKK